MSRQVGLLGGSFDPVHLGHLALARAARDRAAMDEVLWVPAGQPWQKSRQLASARDRAAMVELVLQGEAGFRLSRIELDRSGPSYTVETVRALQDAPDVTNGIDWWLIIGQDQFARLSTWHEWRELARRVGFAVAARDGLEPEPDPLVASAGLRVRRVPMDAVAVSSTAVRARIAQGLGLTGMVPPAVEAYIAAHALYRNTELSTVQPTPDLNTDTPR